jgi:hypothetical protein
MLIEKEPLPKGASFVLRSSSVEDALRSAGISVQTSLRHVNSRIFFDAYFWPPNPNVAHERFYIRAGVVPSPMAREAREFVETSVLPQFIAWASDILSLPYNSPVRRAQQLFSSEFVGHAPNNSFKPKPLRGSA